MRFAEHWSLRARVRGADFSSGTSSVFNPIEDGQAFLLHLSLGDRSRQRQLSYVRDLIRTETHVVVMGDMNSHLSGLLYDSPLAETDLVPPCDSQPTYPSWRPSMALDHVLVTPTLHVEDSQVLECRLSDHRPIAVTIGLGGHQTPAGVRLAS